MSEESSTAENPPSQDGPAAELEVPEEKAVARFSRRKKMLIILIIAVLGGVAVGVGGSLLISWTKSTPQEKLVTPAPQPDPRQQALIEELKAQKEQLEIRLKEQRAPQAAPVEQATPPILLAPHDETEELKALREKSEKLEAQLIKAREKAARPAKRGKGAPEKVTEECTVPDSENKLSDKLKDCIEGFNSTTR